MRAMGKHKVWHRWSVVAAVTLMAAAVVGVARSGHSETPVPRPWPAEPVTLVVTFPPEGGTEMLTRRLADRKQSRIGQQYVLENRSGARGNIGEQAVARAEPDGHTLLVANSYCAINPAVFSEL